MATTSNDNKATSEAAIPSASDEPVSVKLEAPTSLATISDARTFATSTIVTITVGEEQKTYYVHRSLLVSYSKYFEACLKPNFVEGQTANIVLKDLDDAEEQGIELMIYWLYNGDLDRLFSTTGYNLDNRIKLFRIADRFIMPQLKNDIMDQCRQHFEPGTYATGSEVLAIHRHGLLDSMLGRFHLETLARKLSSVKDILDHRRADQYNKGKQQHFEQLYDAPEALVAVIRCITDHGGFEWADPATVDACTFHEHEPGQECSKK